MAINIDVQSGRHIWLTSDQHFGHSKVIEYCSRPFDCVEEMDSVMMALWNDCVHPDDVVVHLGDFALADVNVVRQLISQLNGHIYLVPGNHDKRWLEKLYVGMFSLSEHPFRILPKVVSVMMYGQHFELCHYPIIDWHMREHGTMHLHGHSHTRDYAGDYGIPRMFNVGVDLNKFAPVRLDHIVNYLET